MGRPCKCCGVCSGGSPPNISIPGMTGGGWILQNDKCCYSQVFEFNAIPQCIVHGPHESWVDYSFTSSGPFCVRDSFSLEVIERSDFNFTSRRSIGVRMAINLQPRRIVLTVRRLTYNCGSGEVTKWVIQAQYSVGWVAKFQKRDYEYAVLDTMCAVWIDDPPYLRWDRVNRVVINYGSPVYETSQLDPTGPYGQHETIEDWYEATIPNLLGLGGENNYIYIKAFDEWPAVITFDNTISEFNNNISCLGGVCNWSFPIEEFCFFVQDFWNETQLMSIDPYVAFPQSPFPLLNPDPYCDAGTRIYVFPGQSSSIMFPNRPTSYAPAYQWSFYWDGYCDLRDRRSWDPPGATNWNLDIQKSLFTDHTFLTGCCVNAFSFNVVKS